MDDKEKDLTSELESKVEEVKDLTSTSAEQAVESASELATSLTSELETKAEEAKEGLSTSVESAKDTATSLVSEAETKVDDVKEAVVGTVDQADLLVENPDEKKKKGFVFGWGILGFFIPLVGLILFLVWRGKDETKRKSKASGIGALVGFIVSIIMTILAIILIFVGLVSFSGNYTNNGSGISNFIQGPNSNRQRLHELAEDFNDETSDIASDTGGVLKSFYATVEGDDTLVMNVAFGSDMSALSEVDMKDLMISIIKPLFYDTDSYGVQNLQVKVIVKNSDGKELLNTTFNRENLGF